MAYLFLQCADERCRFRFPAEAAEAEALRCPRCRGRVAAVAEAATGGSATEREPQSSAPVAPHIVGVLDNIRSIHNVGSMFRSADGAGLSHLYLTGITATPEHPKLGKAALGAENTVAWSYHPNGVDAVAQLRERGYRLWALERTADAGKGAIDVPLEPLALVVGNERAGVDPGILAQCEAVLALPMLGQKASLNAAVAFGIAVYYLRFGRYQWAPE